MTSAERRKERKKERKGGERKSGIYLYVCIRRNKDINKE
jgi:hypothetical protein